MSKKYKYILLAKISISIYVFFALFHLSGCKKYVPSTPAFFIKATTISVNTTSVQGSSSNKITELYLYTNGKFQGAYPVGNLMPIANNNQNVKIDVFAGIKNNGLKETRITWIFYDKIQIDTMVESGKTIERPFTFKYNPDVKFEWVEGFENLAGSSIVNSSVSSTAFSLVTSPESFEGKSLKMQLTTNQTIAQVESALPYSLPSGTSNVYLELNYKCFQEFTVGLIDNVTGTQKLAFTINPSTSWNKIYIALGDAVNNQPTSSSHKIYFKMVKKSDNDDSRVYLDNIKVVHF